MSAKEIIHITEEKMKKSIESLRREFMEVRTGRAHPGLIEGMHIDYYGTPTLLKQMASIAIPDPRSIVVQPWDVTILAEIEKAINNSKLGVNAMSDGKIVRIVIPQLSEERRKELAKVVKDMAENGRISIRTIRRESNEKIKKMQTDSAVTEDESFKGQEHIQKLTDKFIKDIDTLLDEKSRELTEFK
jgi:ribosome recycling factor